MMRLLILLMLFSHRIFSQEVYYVSHIEGKVKMAVKKKSLVVGQPVLLKDSLIFATRQDYVCLISPVKGSRIARLEKDVYPGKRNELVMCLKDMLFPAVTVVPTAARGGLVMNSMFDFKNYLSAYASLDAPLLVIDSLDISLGATFNNDPENEFFYARYLYLNQTVNKKINFRKARTGGSIELVLNDSIYRINGKPVDQTAIDSIQIYYYDAKKEQSYLAGTVRLRVISNEALRNEWCVIKTHFVPAAQKETAEQQLKETLFSHILSNYGKIDKESAERVYKILKVRSCLQ